MSIHSTKRKKLATTVVAYIGHRSSNYCLDILIMRKSNSFNVFRGAFL